MATESQGVDPYEAVLADLRARRDQLDQTIKLLEAQRGGAAIPAISTNPSQIDTSADHPGAFLGMTKLTHYLLGPHLDARARKGYKSRKMQILRTGRPQRAGFSCAEASLSGYPIILKGRAT